MNHFTFIYSNFVHLNVIFNTKTNVRMYHQAILIQRVVTNNITATTHTSLRREMTKTIYAYTLNCRDNFLDNSSTGETRK